MSDVEVIDLISYANDNKPVDFAATINNILGQKAIDALSQYKQAIAQNMFNNGTESEEQTQEDESEEEENTSDSEENNYDETQDENTNQEV